MFGEKKLMVLKNIFSNKSFQEDLAENFEKMENLKDIIVVYESDSVDQRLKVFKILTNNCKSQEFKLLEGSLLKNWVQKEFEKLGQKINQDALNLLISYVGNDLWRASNEIKKLSNFKRDLSIRKEDVELQVRPKIEIDIFKTIDALAARDKKQAFSFLKKHLEGGDDPLYLISMVAYQFRNLLLVKELAENGLMYNSIVKRSGLHPFVVKKNYFSCQRFSLSELKKIYRKIFQIDCDIKSGKIDSETALDLLVLQI
jgi:DNA polymerase-3 subunit delta